MTQIGPAIQQRAKALRDVVVMCRARRCATEVCLRQTAISRSSCEAEFLRSQCLRRRTSGTRRNSSRSCTANVSVRLEMDSASGTTHSTAQRTRRTQCRNTLRGYSTVDTRKTCLSVGEWARKTILQISSRSILDGPRTQSLARKLGLGILGGTNDD